MKDSDAIFYIGIFFFSSRRNINNLEGRHYYEINFFFRFLEKEHIKKKTIQKL